MYELKYYVFPVRQDNRIISIKNLYPMNNYPANEKYHLVLKFQNYSKLYKLCEYECTINRLLGKHIREVTYRLTYFYSCLFIVRWQHFKFPSFSFKSMDVLVSIHCSILQMLTFFFQSKETERTFLLGCFKMVIDALIYISAGYVTITCKGKYFISAFRVTIYSTG